MPLAASDSPAAVKYRGVAPVNKVQISPVVAGGFCVPPHKMYLLNDIITP
jgi:hypothetical protein